MVWLAWPLPYAARPGGLAFQQPLPVRVDGVGLGDWTSCSSAVNSFCANAIAYDFANSGSSFR